MSRMIFERSKKLTMMCGTEEDRQFVSALYLVFHQIFLYRLDEVELDIGKYEQYRPSSSISTFQDGHRVTLYTVYQNVIDTVMHEQMLKENFNLFNSYEKISFESFLILVRKKIPDFQGKLFFEVLDSQTQDEKTAIDMRLMADFALTEEWFDYMNDRHPRH